MLKGTGALFLLTGMLCASSCGGGGGSDALALPPVDDPAPIAAADTLQQTVTRASNQGCIAPQFPPGERFSYGLEPAFPGLPGLGALMGMQIDAASGAHWIAHAKDGRVWRFRDSADVASAELVLDISDNVNDFGELGLLGLAQHPDYASNGQLYLYYSPSAAETRLSRFQWSAVTETIDPASESVLLTIPQPRSNHNGGGLAFGPDGYLYLAVGDGGGAFDEFENGQNTATLKGSLLRIDVNGDLPYSIPADNPFADGLEALPEIYAYGLRNPWRMSFDQLTGELWIGDVGQGRREEVNRLVAGANYGWPILEGSLCVEDNCVANGLEPPVLEYDHSRGACAIIGGYVYRGNALAELYGQYIYGDYCSGEVYAAAGLDGAAPTTELVTTSGASILSFAEGPAGELYLLALGSESDAGIFAFNTVSVEGAPPVERLSELDCFASLAPLQLSEGVYSYDIPATLWSDGATKARYFAIPDDSALIPTFDGDLIYPEGSVLIKNFFLGERIVETRLTMRHSTGWRGYSYAWNEAADEALLLEDSASRVIDGSGYYFPSPGECFECHTAAAEFVLGPDIMQMNSLIESGESNLEALERLGMLGFADLILPLHRNATTHGLQAAATVTERARSYLHANCSSCHRADGPAGFMDLRRQVPFADTGLCNVLPSQGDMGIDGARRLVPMDPARSLVLQRMRERGELAMPPLASAIVDDAAVAVVREWILSLASCESDAGQP